MNTLKEIKSALAFLKPVYGSKPCAYCKALATDREHVVPFSFLHVGKHSYKYNDLIVPSCRECNSLCSDRVFDNFWDKKQYIHERLSLKYKNVLRSPDWNSKDISEMKGELKKLVIFTEELKKLLRIRMENLQNPECFTKYEIDI